MRHLPVALLLFAWAFVSLMTPVRRTSAQQGPAAPEAPAKFLGVARCGGTNCHGQEQPRQPPPHMNESISWAGVDAAGFPHDFHSYAWRRLSEDPLSPRIMEALNQREGTNDEATSSGRCVTCHGASIHDLGRGRKNPRAPVALYPELRGAMFRKEEGVTCDGCHGPAEKWLKPHEKRGWAAERWNEAGGRDGGGEKLYDELGLYYSKDLVLWAEQCVRCHLRIDTNMLDAGHLDLISFELFGQNEYTPHWRDYSREQPSPDLPAAGPSHAAVVWIVGQTVTVREAARQLRDRTLGTAHDRVDTAHVRNAIQRLGSHWVALRAGLATLAPDARAPLAAAIDPLLAMERDDPHDHQALAAGATRVIELLAPLPRRLADLPPGSVDLARVEAIMAALLADRTATADGLRAAVLMRSLYALNYARLSHRDPQALVPNPPTEPVMIALDEMWEDPDPVRESFKAALEKIRAALAK